MHSIAILALAAATAAPAAADKPIVAPPPAWVHPVAFPAEIGKSTDAPVRLILQDQQLHFGPEGATTYAETAMAIQAPQGLGVGSISFPWNPDISTLTVHKLVIRRGDKVIDVLASGQTFTVVRREANLENAVLDGVLTANIQPEGLQVGDIIDFAVSVTIKDPALQGHVEAQAGGWGVLPIDRVTLAASWPKTRAIRQQEVGPLPALEQATDGSAQAVSFAVDDFAPITMPNDAPPRFRTLPRVEFSDFKSWAELSALMAPLYDKAATVPAGGALSTEIARIAAATSDPKARAQAALDLVQDRVRYVFLAANDGGLVPADAATTWDRRFGDCKGKTALLLGVLKALGVAAQPVMVSTTGGDGLDQDLPMIELFDHILVRAQIGGRTYWLDGTRSGDTDLDAIATPAFGWALPVAPANAALIRLAPPPLDLPADETTVRLDASAGLSVPGPAHAETVFRGDAAIALNMQLSQMPADTRTQALTRYWKSSYDFIAIKSTGARFDAATREEHLTMDGSAAMDWSSGSYETDGTSLGYKADFSREPGPGKDAPFAVSYPSYSVIHEAIVLPRDSTGFTLTPGADIDATIAGVAYRRRAAIKDGVATIDVSQRAVQPEFPAADAPAAQQALRNLYKKTVYVMTPQNYIGTKAELKQQMDVAPTTASGFVTRGNMLMDHGRYKDAIADFDKALAIEPDDVIGRADRGLAHTWLGDYEPARQDLAAAAAIDPHNAIVLHGQGLLALRTNDYAGAITAFSRALDIDPRNEFSLVNRASAFERSKDYGRAAADLEAAIAIDPSASQYYLNLSNVYRLAGNDAKARAQAETVTKTAGNTALAWTVAGAIYSRYHDSAAAVKAFDHAIAIEPNAFSYVNRMHARDESDVAGRRADLEAALKLDPKSGFALDSKADMQDAERDYAGAAATRTIAIQAVPDNYSEYASRGVDYARLGKADLAEKDYATVRAHGVGPEINNLCWAKATAGIALESALADCDAALAKTPNDAGIEDSRGFVLLRLGRLDDAIAQYDKAIAIDPTISSSLYGRAIAESKKGDAAKADVDAAAAAKLEPGVAQRFGKFGVTR